MNDVSNHQGFTMQHQLEMSAQFIFMAFVKGRKKIWEM